MGRDQIRTALLKIFKDKFQIVNPGLDESLRDAHEFDSIDAVELLHEIELLLDSRLTQAEKKSAMDIRTLNQIIDYIERLAAARLNAGAADGVERLSPAAEP
jgi:acyl carrier protein